MNDENILEKIKEFKSLQVKLIFVLINFYISSGQRKYFSFSEATINLFNISQSNHDIYIKK